MMAPIDFNHKIELYAAQAASEEAQAKLQLARAMEKFEMVETMKEMQKAINQLQENQQIKKVEIGTVNGNYIENIQNANLCQPTSKPSTETTSSTSTPTSKINITPLSSK